MKKAYVFPGQGSQFVGMGEEYFDRFHELVEIADSVLGYSIKELCLKDPNKCLNKTNFTQPALFTVNALTYAAKIEELGIQPNVVAGHSLGEYNALLAAGAFDFETGLKLVQKRGELMSQATQGGMLAVLGVDINVVQNTLESLGDINVQVANINSQQQTIISGAVKGIEAATQAFEKMGVKCVPLNVSAAFHSSFMEPSREVFKNFMRGFQFRELEIPVVANITADLYPTRNYEHYLADQISGSVRWHETVLWMLNNGYEQIEEVGPGLVLTKLTSVIKNPPVPVENIRDAIPLRENNLLFMYGGQGFHYLRMGHELYETHPVFRNAMLECDRIVKKHLNVSIAHEFYEKDPKEVDLEDILLTHPAIYSFGYCLTKELESQGLKPKAVLGYSLGEYVAATIAGALSLEDGLMLVCEQAQLLKQQNTNGCMLAVLTAISDMDEHVADYEGATVACINYHQNFILSGEREVLQTIQQRLDQRNVLSVVLPVAHSFHSHHIDPIQNSFKRVSQKITTKNLDIRFYSTARGTALNTVDNEHFWSIIRDQVDFKTMIGDLKKQDKYEFVDLSPTGSLASFLDRNFGKHEKHRFAVNQFGHNKETLQKLIKDVKQPA